jgi:hypothetical protein
LKLLFCGKRKREIMSSIGKTRNTLYKTARILGDIQVISGGSAFGGFSTWLWGTCGVFFVFNWI